MRRHAAAATLLLPLLLCLSARSAQAQATTEINRVAWLTGCWEQRTDTRLVQELWMAPAGGIMIGTSRTVARGAARSWEFLRIASVAGKLTYVALPSGQSETAFAATFVSDTLAVFENPVHDFPQRIAYRRVTSDSIVARVSGKQGGADRGFDIPMRHAATCGA